jgi:hypothetical protein
MTRELTNEHEHGKALMRWAELSLGRIPELALLFHVPNGGRRSKATAGKLKAEGVKAGVPDYVLPVPRGQFHGLFIELKVPKTGKKNAGRLSDTQKGWLAALRQLGYRAETAYGWDQAKDILEEYLG